MNEDLKPKEDILKEVFAHFRKEGFIPWVNDTESNDEHITVDGICIHGKSWVSRYMSKDEDSSLWEYTEEGWSDDRCSVCYPCDDCGDPHILKCPICREPWPKLPEERLIKAWKDDEDLIETTKCPKCAHAWYLNEEETNRLHPETLKPKRSHRQSKAERAFERLHNDKDYQKFADRMDAVKEAMGKAYEPCPKDGCPADVDFIEVDGGSGGPIHMCDFNDLDKRFPGEFSILSDDPEPAVKSGPQRPMRNGRPIGRNSECICGSGKKYKRCCEKGNS
jgi:hypothetical protein